MFPPASRISLRSWIGVAAVAELGLSPSRELLQMLFLPRDRPVALAFEGEIVRPSLACSRQRLAPVSDRRVMSLILTVFGALGTEKVGRGNVSLPPQVLKGPVAANPAVDPQSVTR